MEKTRHWQDKNLGKKRWRGGRDVRLPGGKECVGEARS